MGKGGTGCVFGCLLPVGSCSCCAVVGREGAGASAGNAWSAFLPALASLPSSHPCILSSLLTVDAGEYFQGAITAAAAARGFAGRPGTIKKAHAAILKLMEADSGEAVAEALLQGTNSKKPKASQVPGPHSRPDT